MTALLARSRITPNALAGVLELYEAGQYLQAYQRAVELAPLDRWHGTDARLLAGRMAGNLGSMRLSDWHMLHAWRHDRHHPEALWYYARFLLDRRGPWAAWQFFRKWQLPADASPRARSHWLSLQAATLGRLRDFDRAEELLRQADALTEEAWTCLEWAALLALEDRHAEAEAAARRALELRPWYRPAVQWVAHFLVQQRRDDEALALLEEVVQRLESNAIHGQLAALLLELERYDDAARSLDECERLSPLLDKEFKGWLRARRADLALLRGDLDTARASAREAKGPFYEKLVQRLEGRTEPGRRVILPVAYVQQHHKTCAPATITSICQFWSMPGEHLETAEAISYAGTPNHSERKWAIDQGWFTKEFTVDWDSAVALIDRGVPFTLTTTETTSAHLQAVIGYDTLRETLILRDPGFRNQVELSYDTLVERYRATGPRGLALVPLAERAKLDGLQLPNEALYNQLYRLDVALEQNQREEAGQALAELQALDPRHFLTLIAQRTLAQYDMNSPQALAAVEQLLELFPGDLRLELLRLSYLREVGQRQDRLETLRALVNKHPLDPSCRLQYAEELVCDARQQTQAIYHFQWALRLNPMLAYAYSALGRLRWEQHRRQEALELYHVAVCQEDKDEGLVRTYFQAARWLGKTDEVLQFLERRFARFGKKSANPARTLYIAYLELERLQEGFRVLEQAMQLRPCDGELLVYAAEAAMFQGELPRADEILRRAEGISRPGARLRTQALVAANRHDPAQARALWAQVLQLEPLAEDAHRAYAQLLAEQEGRAAAVEHLRGVCLRFPHHFGLTRLWLEWIREDGAEARHAVLTQLLLLHPADAWVRRELAINLVDLGKLDEAQHQVDEAARLEPLSRYLGSTQAYVSVRAGQIPQAQEALRQSLRLAIDSDYCMQELVGLCDALEERREALDFLEQELVRQVTFGEGLLTFRAVAQMTLAPDELLSTLRRGLEARPDLWHAWIAVIRQLVSMDRGAEALALAQQAAERFPLLPALWLELAGAQRAVKDGAGEIVALERAVQLAPSWNPALRALAAAHERHGELARAREVLEQAIARAPLLGAGYFDYAELLWRAGDDDAAIAQARQSLDLDAGLEAAWMRLGDWLAQKNRLGELVDLARRWTERRPGEPRSWIRLGQALQRLGPQPSLDEENRRLRDLLAAYDQAQARNPSSTEVADLKAEALALAGRYQEARELCLGTTRNGKPSLPLRARAAWVTALEGDLAAAKRQMREVLEQDRNYQWAWTQLADWCVMKGEYAEYLEAANELIRISPQSAQALACRGEARVRTGEREAGMEDLRMALRRDPANVLAGYILFDEQLHDGNLLGAAATLRGLQEHLGGDFVLARAVQLAARQAERDAALESFRQLCASPTLQAAALDMALYALEQAGWKAEAEQALREALQRERPRACLALSFARRWNANQPNDLNERIAALDKVLAFEPQSFVLLDLKAELSVGGGHFEKALETAQQPTLPQDAFALRGRAAWVLYRWGKAAEGLELMTRLLQAHPTYHWGWGQLAEWRSNQGDWAGVVNAAETLVELAPRDPSGYGHRGRAYQMLGKRDLAKADYNTAIDLAPNYLFAYWQLYEMHVADREWQQAEKILDAAKPYADPCEWSVRKVDLQIYRNKPRVFEREFKALCEHSAANSFWLQQSLNFVQQSGWSELAEPVLHDCLHLGPVYCEEWVRVRVAMGDQDLSRQIEAMADQPQRVHCLAAYALELVYAKKPAQLRRWVREHSEPLHREAQAWAKVGFAFDLVQDPRGVVEWMADWARQPQAKPGDLLPLVRALRGLDRLDEARKVSLHALTKLAPDYGAAFHKLWLMFDQAHTDDLAPVRRYLDQDDLGGLDVYHQFIAAMVRALCAQQQDARGGLRKARQILAEAAKKPQPVRHDAALRRSYQRCLRTLAQRHGGLGARLWSIFRSPSLYPRLPPAQP